MCYRLWKSARSSMSPGWDPRSSKTLNDGGVDTPAHHHPSGSQPQDRSLSANQLCLLATEVRPTRLIPEISDYRPWRLSALGPKMPWRDWISTMSDTLEGFGRQLAPRTVEEDVDGWGPDPFGTHEERFFKQGEPTPLVRDGGIGSLSEPPAIQIHTPVPSDETHMPGWWLASDGKWYPPEQHARPLPSAPPPPAPSRNGPQEEIKAVGANKRTKPVRGDQQTKPNMWTSPVEHSRFQMAKAREIRAAHKSRIRTNVRAEVSDAKGGYQTAPTAEKPWMLRSVANLMIAIPVIVLVTCLTGLVLFACADFVYRSLIH